MKIVLGNSQGNKRPKTRFSVPPRINSNKLKERALESREYLYRCHHHRPQVVLGAHIAHKKTWHKFA